MVARVRRWWLLALLFAPAVTAAQADGGPPPDGGAGPPVLTAPGLLADSPALYPPDAARAGLGGVVELEVVVGEDGLVSEARVTRGVSPQLDHAAVEAAAGLRFTPATSNGVPVPSLISWTYTFTPPPPPPPRARVEGELKRQGRNTPVPGAQITARESSGAAPGPVVATALAGADGRFALDLPAGTWLLTIAAPGFKKSERGETLAPGEKLTVVYYVPATGGAFESTVLGERTRTEVARTDLQGDELRAVPGTMGGDPFRAILTLPGVSNIISGVGFPVVRGAAPASTGWFVDGVRIPQLFHFFLLSAVIHPRFIEGISFYPSAYPADYGRLTGGVVAAQTAQGKQDHARGEISVDWINTGAFVETPVDVKGEKFSVAAGGRFSYTSLALSLLNQSGYADYWDYQARVEHALGGEKGTLRLFAFGSYDEAGSKDPVTGARQRALSILFHRLDLRWRGPALGAAVEASLTGGTDGIGLGDTFDISARLLAPRVTASWRLGRLTLRTGLDGEWKRIEVAERNPNAGPGDASSYFIPVTGVVGGSFVEAGVEVGPVTIVPAVRADWYHTAWTDQVAPEPRFGVRWQLDEKTALHAASGLYHQAPTTFIEAPGVDLLALGAGFDHTLQSSVNSEVGVERRVDQLGVEVTATGYWSEGLVVRELQLGQDPDETQRIIDGTCSDAQPGPGGTGGGGQTCQPLDPFRERRGRSYGVELMVRRKLGDRLFGWLAYTLSRTERWTPGYAVYPFAYDKTHILNAVASYELGDSWTFALGIHWNTGDPYDPKYLVYLPAGTPLPSDGRYGGVVCNPVTSGPIPCWIPKTPLSGRLPPFFRVDARVEKRWTYDRYTMALYLDVLNATGSSEVLSRDYGFDYPSGAPKVTDTSVPVVVPMLGLRGSF